jgi:hypothetical protein
MVKGELIFLLGKNKELVVSQLFGMDGKKCCD